MRTFLSSLPVTENTKFDWLKDGIFRKEQVVFTHQTSHGKYKLPETMESAGTFQMLML